MALSARVPIVINVLYVAVVVNVNIADDTRPVLNLEKQYL